MDESQVKQRNGGVVPSGTAPLVFWDGYGLGHPYSGVSRYAHDLYESLQSIGVRPFIVAPELPFFPCEHEVVPAAGPIKKILNSKLVWPGRSYSRASELAENAGKSAIFHGLSNITVPMKKTAGPRTVITIHDLIPLLAPGQVSAAYNLQFAFAVKKIIPSVDHIIAVSDWTAQTIEERFPGTAGKVTVIKNGRQAAFRAVPQDKSEGPVSILTVSRFETYKNLSVIGDIALQCANGMAFDLVSDHRASAFFKKRFGALIENKTIRLHIGLDENEIDRLFQKADCYFHPSLYEGFCLPVMKAASFAVPVVFLMGSAIDEIALPEFSVGATENDVGCFIEAIQTAVLKRKSPNFYENVKEKFLQFPTWDDAALSLKNLYTAVSDSN